jgi:hypothetical protein
MKRLGLASVALAVVFLTAVGAAGAAALKVCVPEKEGAPVVTAKAGVCKAKYTATTLLPEAIASHINYVEKGVGGKPTIQFSGVNVQVVAGAKEAEATGLGNLVVGNNEVPGAQTGSNNLILGTEGQEFTSYGGILAGNSNTISGPFASVTGGSANHASGADASVSGGSANAASGEFASVTGGLRNKAQSGYASVSSGLENNASGEFAWVSGGGGNSASGG